MQLNGETKLIGFFGSTYRTSKMYAMYNAAIQAMNLNFLYVPFAVHDLEKAVAGIRNLGVAAVGVTIPYKIEIMDYIDELDSNAKRVGAVSVVLNKNGKLVGGNTDGEGALRALQEKTSVKDKNIIILGCGGAARAIAFALKNEGCRITILNRTESKAKELATAVDNNVPFGGYESLPDLITKNTVLINTTPVGMANTAHEGQSLVPEQLLGSDMTVMDIVSKPKETKLLQDAGKRGCTLVYGYRMLLWQGVLKFKMYTDVEPPIEVMEEAMENIK